MNKEIVNLQVINGLKSKGYNIDDMDFNLLNDFTDIMYKAINVMQSSLQLKGKHTPEFDEWLNRFFVNTPRTYEYKNKENKYFTEKELITKYEKAMLTNALIV